MKVRIAVPAVVVALLLAGCQTVPYESTVKPRGPKDCKGITDCVVDVHPEMGVLPEDVLATKGRGMVIKWQLDPRSDWSWLGSGIVFKDPRQKVLECDLPLPSPVRICRNTGAEGKYEFGVKLVNWKTLKVIDYDPFVMNQ